ncbi:CCCH zinc finger DNA binding protein [Paracoccidioides lutzii Pb01]|uniref:CCCH zinc finger DNA binding protein n=1 Tax=Paracoccidioides lutzii (strain ATCC MYA-826 / Pb01) TaxID=502779 RepID=C1H7V4_PARBA|nr:CCCH zinc finger DNA binding protein [Paracoccidioides lutzii Pb01]EEH36427.2 CCCH zinc finger DNA binding protein [Paracoccidioides lutzii Pb01]
MERIEGLEKDIDEKKVLLEKQEDMANMYHQRSREAKLELMKTPQNMERNAFVSVLFLDKFVIDGKSRVKKLPDSSSTMFKSLRRTYQEAQILDDEEEFELFVHGFNIGHPMCDFVDAGAGKECSDEKIRLHAGNVHRKHITFASSTNSGYARLLGPYSSTEVCNRVTMLEGPPFERELAELKDKYRTTSFPTVFRETKLPPTRFRRPRITDMPTNPRTI